jgi:hypothetical protein
VEMSTDFEKGIYILFPLKLTETNFLRIHRPNIKVNDIELKCC